MTDRNDGQWWLDAAAAEASTAPGAYDPAYDVDPSELAHSCGLVPGCTHTRPCPACTEASREFLAADNGWARALRRSVAEAEALRERRAG